MPIIEAEVNATGSILIVVVSSLVGTSTIWWDSSGRDGSRSPGSSKIRTSVRSWRFLRSRMAEVLHGRIAAGIEEGLVA